jgi:integrase/recombinase XerD
VIHTLKLSPKQWRAFTKCECPIWVSGRTDQGIVPRQSTGTADWATAEKLLASLGGRQGLGVDDCVRDFLASREGSVTSGTQSQTRTALARFVQYCNSRGVTAMSDISVDLLERYRVDALGKMKSSSKQVVVSKVMKFLREAYRRSWIPEQLAGKVAPVVVVKEQKSPFTDEEIDKILDEARRIQSNSRGFGRHPETFAVLLRLMLETGLRVSDAINFNPAVCERGESMYIYTFIPEKSVISRRTHHVECYLTPDLYGAVVNTPWLSKEFPFRWASTLCVYRSCYKFMQGLGVKDCRPHRLRDTFAVRCLNRGMALEDVSRLLGHATVAVTEMYYAKWVRSRKLRLERLVAETLIDPGNHALRDTQSAVSACP